MVELRSRPLDAVYSIVYVDCMAVKIGKDKKVISKDVYLAMGNLKRIKKSMLTL